MCFQGILITDDIWSFYPKDVAHAIGIILQKLHVELYLNYVLCNSPSFCLIYT